MKNDVYAYPLPSNSVCNGPNPALFTSPASTDSYLSTGIPSTIFSNDLDAIACCIFVNECTAITADSLPLPTMYSPLGSTSTPCGDLGVGRKYMRPSQRDGSSTMTLVFRSTCAAFDRSSSTLWS